METMHGEPVYSAAFETRLKKLCSEGVLTYKKDHSLKKMSSFKIGGSIDYAVFPMTPSALVEVLQTVKEFDIPFRVFGNCTNVLFDDEGVRGCGIFLKYLEGIKTDNDTIAAEAGALDSVLARTALGLGLGGMEFLYGIPGTIAGAIYMNGGAFGGEISQICRSVTAMNLSTGEVGTIEGEKNDFGYRRSVYMDGNLIILTARFQLTHSDPGEIYAKMVDYAKRRKEKQPLSFPSAGSFFKRCPPYFAGKLIEDTGLKGLTVGGAQVSEKHAGFIINTGNATSADVKELGERVIDAVREKFGVTLTREVEYIPVVLRSGGEK